MDVMGGVFLVDGSELKVVTGIDDHSRFCVSAMVVRRATARPVCDALAAAMSTHGIPDQILTDNGKVFTGRFGPGTGEVLFDRICRENGVRHLLTAPRSPTTTGKVERFHKTLKKDFLAGNTFETLEEAQKAVDGWVVEYNTERPHQGIGGVPPVRRFELAVVEPFEVVAGDDQSEAPEVEVAEEPRRVTRKVGQGGRISMATFPYHVGRWLAGETVDVTITVDGLVEISPRGVLVATHARQHPPEAEPQVWRRQPRARPVRPATVGQPVVRKVDSSGGISFAGVSYDYLEKMGSVQWPCNEKFPVGSPIMHVDGFVRGKGKFVRTEYVPTDEKTGPRYPLLLTTGRILSQYNVGAQTRRTANVLWHDEDLLEIHPHDAENRGIREGDWVKLASRAGETTLRATVTDRVAPGVVYTTFHYPLTQANVVTTEYSDWATNCPEYKVTAVQVSPSNGPSDWQERYAAQAEMSRRIETAE